MFSGRLAPFLRYGFTNDLSAPKPPEIDERQLDDQLYGIDMPSSPGAVAGR